MKNILKRKRGNNSFQFTVVVLLLLFLLQGQLNQLYAADKTQSTQKEPAYPATPEGVVEVFINANYSEEAIKKYWLDVTDDKTLNKYKKNYGLYFNCKEMSGLLASDSIWDNFTVKRNNGYTVETDMGILKGRKHGTTDVMREKGKKGDVAEVSVFFDLVASFGQGGQIDFLPYEVKKALAVSRMKAPGCLGFLLMKSNNLWKIESVKLTDECFNVLDDFYAKSYKDKTIKGDYTVMIDTPISKECFICGVENKITKYKDDKEFVNGLKDCIKAIEEKRNCRAYSHKIK